MGLKILIFLKMNCLDIQGGIKVIKGNNIDILWDKKNLDHTEMGLDISETDLIDNKLNEKINVNA